jgi:hypothetical protein
MIIIIDDDVADNFIELLNIRYKVTFLRQVSQKKRQTISHWIFYPYFAETPPNN